MANDETIAAMSANDTAQAAAMPKPVIPEGYEGIKFSTPDLPVVPLTLRRLEDGAEFGPFFPEAWITDTNTGITTNHDLDGKVFALRVLEESRSGTLLMLHSIDDEGRTVTYLVNEVPDNTLEAPEVPGSSPTHEEGLDG